MQTMTRILALLMLIASIAASATAEESNRRHFSHFSMILPEGWDGDEQTGFISDDPAEYQLTLGLVRDNNYVAQVSVFLLPNKPGATAEKAARQLAEAQGNASKPVQEGKFWVFNGEPRTKALKGMAKTLVHTTPAAMLIIIAQDPDEMGSSEILQSLRGETPLAVSLLGR